ncbi:MAG TPA: imidazoleglycerol-phosphate dehydratase HisB [Peptococcaceae bacterium]|nr:imidazoleglycerol-phosphate dehydratase HisB [Peptococcaceae bacterium]
MREGKLERNTKETSIQAWLALDGTGCADVSTGIGFFDHMLISWAVHGGFDLTLKAEGDLQVDGHHTVEDCGIVLGKALGLALADKSGLCRYGSFWLPMDDALAMAAVDVSGRPFLHFNAAFRNERIGDFETCLTREFFQALAFNAGITLHINLLYGENDHHGCEAIFKAVGHALSGAVMKNSSGEALSTKGVLA